MTYELINWKDFPNEETPLSSFNLNHMDTQIKRNADDIELLKKDVKMPATTERAGIVKPDGTTITVDEDGTIHGSASLVSDAYNPSRNYSAGEFCIYNNTLWKSKVNNNTGNIPTEDSYWTSTSVTNDVSAINQKITNVDNKFYLADRSIKSGVGILGDDKTYYFDVQDNEHIHRVVFNDTNILAQKFKNNGEFVETTFNSVLKPVVAQIEFINGSSLEPSNCTYTITGNQLIVNLAGFIYEGAGSNVIANLGAFQYTTCARANVMISNGAIIYINANDKNLAITGSTGGSVYCQLIIPIING